MHANEKKTERFCGKQFEHLIDTESARGVASRFKLVVDIVDREKPTIRQLVQRLAGARGHSVIAGPPEKIADNIQTCFENDAADGLSSPPTNRRPSRPPFSPTASTTALCSRTISSDTNDRVRSNSPGYPGRDLRGAILRVRLHRGMSGARLSEWTKGDFASD